MEAKYLSDAKKLFENERISFLIDKEEQDKVEEQKQKVNLQLYDTLSLARTYLVDIFQGYDATYSIAKSYILFSAFRVLQGLYINDELDQEVVTHWMKQWDAQNCAALVQTMEPIAARMDIKAAKILELLGKLFDSEAMESLLDELKDNTLKEDYDRWSQDAKMLEKELQDFSDYFRNHYNLAFENYFVYTMFWELIPEVLDKDKLGKNFFNRVIIWCIIQLCAMSIWKRKGEVTKEDYSLIVSGTEQSFSRRASYSAETDSILEEDNIAMLLLYLIC